GKACRGYSAVCERLVCVAGAGAEYSGSRRCCVVVTAMNGVLLFVAYRSLHSRKQLVGGTRNFDLQPLEGLQAGDAGVSAEKSLYRFVRLLRGFKLVMPVFLLRSSDDRLVSPLRGSRLVMPGLKLRSSDDRLVSPLRGSRLVMPVFLLRSSDDRLV